MTRCTWLARAFDWRRAFSIQLSRYGGCGDFRRRRPDATGSMLPVRRRGVGHASYEERIHGGTLRAAHGTDGGGDAPAPRGRGAIRLPPAGRAGRGRGVRVLL